MTHKLDVPFNFMEMDYNADIMTAFIMKITTTTATASSDCIGRFSRKI